MIAHHCTVAALGNANGRDVEHYLHRFQFVMVEQEISREVLTPNALRFRFIIWYHIIHSVNGDESDITVAVVLVNVNQVERPDEYGRNRALSFRLRHQRI